MAGSRQSRINLPHRGNANHPAPRDATFDRTADAFISASIAGASALPAGDVRTIGVNAPATTLRVGGPLLSPA